MELFPSATRPEWRRTSLAARSFFTEYVSRESSGIISLVGSGLYTVRRGSNDWPDAEGLLWAISDCGRIFRTSWPLVVKRGVGWEQQAS